MKQFQSFRLDTVNHCLWHAEERVPLAPKAFDVLRYLVEHPGRLVTQDEILEALWPETYVNPELIKKYILGIRKVLGDSPNKPVFIENFPKRGYQFVATVRDEDPAGSLDVPLYPAKKMVGRDTALDELERYLNLALEGRRQLIFVTGEAGIGKTMLVDVFHQRVASRPNVRMARGQCVEGFGGKEAYYPMLEALGQLIRETDTSPVAQTLAKRAPTWWIQFPSLVKAEGREALQREILGATRTRMVREICEALEAITAEHPLVVIFEDLHWVDPSTLDLISALARRREPAKLMLLGTYRPTDVALFQTPLKGLKQDLQVHQLCKEIALERLEESTIAEYLGTEFPKASFPPGISDLVFRHSGGNALFMVAIVQDLVKKGLIAQEHGRWKLTQPLEGIDPGVPETLQQMLEVQFEQLNVEEQRILKSGSTAGEHFSVWAIATTLDIEADQIEDYCEGLAQKQQFIKSAGIQELASSIVSANFEFRHSLYRQAIYRKLSDGNRSKLHRSLGERFGSLCTPDKPELASEVAFHLEQGHEYEKALQYLILAAEDATRRFAHRNAIQILQHALKLVLKIPSSTRVELEIKVLERIGEAHYALEEMTEAAQAYDMEVARASQAGLKRAEVHALGRLAYVASPTDSERGIAASGRAVQVSKDLDDPQLLARTQILAAAFRILHDRWSQEDAHILAANLEIVRSSGTPLPVVYEMLYASQALIMQGEYTDALQTVQPDPPNMAQTSGLMTYLSTWGEALALLHRGEFGNLLRVLRTVLETARKNGNNLWLGAFTGIEAWLRTLVSDFEGARELCESVLPMCTGRPARTPRAVALLASGQAELGLGNSDSARRYFEQLEEMTGERFYLYWYWRMHSQLGLARAWLESGNIANAGMKANCFLESALSTSDPNMQVLAWEVKTRIAMAEEDWTAAGQSVRAALAVLEKHDVPISAWRANSTAWEFFRHQNNRESAELHRVHAEQGVLALAHSLPEQEPLRAIFLASDPVRRVLGHATRRTKPSATVKQLSKL
jgi:DNA-binding winged helix-turn-helix (wHTH) protein/tetratricopeptide (TPR) repeat protein